MKYGILSLIALVFACMLYAQDIDMLLGEAEKLERDLKETESLNKYKEVLQVQPGNVKALWKSGELTGRIGNRLKDEKQKAAYFTTAENYADAALKANPLDADANYLKAATAARFTAISSGKDKARHLRDMKNYADSALLVNPSHGRALYILGRWNYDIYNLSTIEKGAVKILSGGMPKASLEAAIQYFEKARAADPWLVINALDLANAYVAFHQTDKAIEVLNKMVKLPPRTQDDQGYKTQGKALLASLQ